MSVVANRSGNTATVTVTIDVSEIIAMTGISNSDKRRLGLIKARAELTRAIVAHTLNDQQIDDRTAAVELENEATKLARATGNL